MKLTKLILTSLTLIVFTSCSVVDEPIAIQLTPSPSASGLVQPVILTGTNAPAPAQTNRVIEKRFVDSRNDSTDAIGSALTWAKRYEDLSLKTEKLRETNNRQLIEITDLRHNITQLEAGQKQTTDELRDATDFMEAQQLELTRWKSDVLGFRNEIRAAQATQLKALIKVLKLLGAEEVDFKVE